MRQVVISGIGIVSPNGVGKEAFWNSTIEGRSGISKIDSFDTSGHAVQVGGEVKEWDPVPYLNGNRKSLKVMGRNVQFGIAAAKMAMQDTPLGLVW
jgi:3-oxoacyl-[acyl-carrier-protein] synthase II